MFHLLLTLDFLIPMLVHILLCTLFIFYKNAVFPAQAEYSYFSADFKLKIFLYYS